ncbi:MAG: hypothetical protein NZ700_05665 [Gemmataceae bacterium]|nr:hypothetical protein [Gemmataceae bacterium]MDW8264745.1 hypothetical protein [Gemmataceae bacterium]
MRPLTVVLLTLVAAVALSAQPAQDANLNRRYGIEVNQGAFPQGSPKETLTSVVKAMKEGKIDYLLAHLADPTLIDDRVRDLGGQFGDLVKEVTERLTREPDIIKSLERLLREGQWEEQEKTASVKPKDGGGLHAFFTKRGQRWFIENRTEPEP